MSKEIFALDADKCASLSSDYSNALELESEVSEGSPGVVANNEIIARQVHSPIHIDEDGELIPDFFNDAFDKGLSTNRLGYIDLPKFNQHGESKAERDRVSKPNRVYHGYVTAEVGKVRALFEGQIPLRIYGVYDSALPTDASHADICCILPKDGSTTPPSLPRKALGKARRAALRECFSEVKKV